MAENLLSDARVRSASFEVDGHYLPDGGGLRIRLLPVSRNHPKGARLAEYHFKVKTEGQYRHGSIHLGTIGDAFTDAAGITRPFTLKDARAARDAAREQVSKGMDPRESRRLAEREAAEPAVAEKVAAPEAEPAETAAPAAPAAPAAAAAPAVGLGMAGAAKRPGAKKAAPAAAPAPAPAPAAAEPEPEAPPETPLQGEPEAAPKRKRS